MPTYSKSQLTKAIRQQCEECNDLKSGWDNHGNDCTGKTCPLYPFRPGNGPGHAETPIRGRKGNPEAFSTRRHAVSKAPNGR